MRENAHRETAIHPHSFFSVKAGIRAYVAIPNFDFRDTDLFGPGYFRYDSKKDFYVCPADEHLHRHARTSGNRGTRYRAKPEACNACELKAKCTTSEGGRMLYRPFEEDYYDRVRAYRGTFAYEKALRKRQGRLSEGAAMKGSTG